MSPRATCAALAAASAVSLTAVAAQSAQAAQPSSTTTASSQKGSAQKDTSWNLGYDTQASTTVKKMNSSASTTGFTFATVHVEKGTLASDLQLKEFKMPVKLGGLKVAYATVAVEPVGKATGKIDTTKHTVTQHQTANLRVKDISLTGHGLINLAGKDCHTQTTTSIDVSGPFKGGFDTLKLSGTYTIPKFTGCGAVSGLVSNQVSGPGNTINLTLTPHA